MTKNNESKNPNTLMSWATGNLALYAVGIAAGIFIWKSGLLQKLTGKLFSKKETKNQDKEENNY